MGERAEEGETGGLEAPPRPVGREEEEEAGVAGAERRARPAGVERGLLVVERAGVVEACLSLALLLPAAGRAAGTAVVGAAVAVGAADGAGG